MRDVGRDVAAQAVLALEGLRQAVEGLPEPLDLDSAAGPGAAREFAALDSAGDLGQATDRSRERRRDRHRDEQGDHDREQARDQVELAQAGPQLLAQSASVRAPSSGVSSTRPTTRPATLTGAAALCSRSSDSPPPVQRRRLPRSS